MQYILTEDEYQVLKAKSENTTPNKELHLKCIKAACSINITLDWGGWAEKPAPWGCPYSEEVLPAKTRKKINSGELDYDDIDDDSYIEYCDECPVQDLCPSAKHWSQ